jgi:3-hydroxyisobutyrate dehydrogenase-like beta-hydroxyacid dehydrogenase
MKLGIIGIGNVGGTLGTAWAARGHDVTLWITLAYRQGLGPGIAFKLLRR